MNNEKFMKQEETNEYLEARNKEWASWARMGKVIAANAIAGTRNQPLWNNDTWGQPKAKPPTETVLQEAHNLITGARNKTYGDAIDDYTRVSNVFEALTGVYLSPAQCIVFMTVLKQCRLVTNLEKQLWHRDSAVDTAGYLGCLETVVDALKAVDAPLWGETPETLTQ